MEVGRQPAMMLFSGMKATPTNALQRDVKRRSRVEKRAANGWPGPGHLSMQKIDDITAFIEGGTNDTLLADLIGADVVEGAGSSELGNNERDEAK